MTTIDEMDEFFDFDDAARQLDNHPCSDLNHLPSGPYDIDLAFAEPENDQDAFDSIEHFTASNHTDDQLALQLQHAGGGVDTTMMSPGDFADFPRWVDGLYFPSKPCAYCRSRKIHCKIIKEGHRKGSCTSCVALSRACSLTFDPDLNSWTSQDNLYDLSKFDLSANSSKRSSGNFDLDHETLPGINGKVYTGLTTLRPCEYCHNRGYECKVIQEGERSGSCTSCVALEHACSLVTQESPDEMELNIDDPRYPNPINAWNTTKVLDEESTLIEHTPGGHTIAGLQGLKLREDDLANTGEGAKVGARFSRESVRILRAWLSTHHRHPYPSDDERESLQRQTGLNKTQITNWLANARRRGKVRAPRSTSPMPVSNYAHGMDIPRRATPSLEAMNPMDRWKHSPPEHEPASITAISKAVASSTLSGHESPYSYGFSDDGSAFSIANVSSTSSLGTSHSSGGSFASAFSHKSRGSFGSFSSFGNRGRRRRRRQAAKPAKVSNTFYTPPRTFQCTFCTETFKTKHDWQRHEKSLHLSLERWVCSPNGPLAFCAEYNHQACVYCRLQTPPENHAETHNHSVCAERPLEERTFYRKDHLRQHLNLVHNVKFQGWSMDAWKVATPEIRSRCGFCGIVLDTWSIRVDHLAEHFKGGRSMADWKGDWGFEQPVLEVVENAMPPYLIHDERNTPRPFEASTSQTEAFCRTTFDALGLGLVDYINNRVVKGETLTDADLLLEAQKIFNILEGLSEKGFTADSWFRDLIMSSCTPGQQERLKFQESKNSGIHKFDFQRLDIKAMERPCQKENNLQAYVNQRMALGLTPTDSELQREACRIIEESEAVAVFRCKSAVGWFKYLANSSTTWLMDFRRRANLPRSDEMASENIRSTDDTTIDYSIHTYGRLETELRDYTKLQMSLGFTPSDAELQAKARMIIYGHDDPWNQTDADRPSYLSVFKKKYGLAPKDGSETSEPADMFLLGNPEQQTSMAKEYHSPKSLHWNLEDIAPPCGKQIMDQLETIEKDEVLRKSNPTRPLLYFLNDANCYRRLVRELARFVTSCMSPNNPTQHVPSDAEIKNQARWVIYDDDDPWNQTAADNAEWLIRFKRDVGLAAPEEGPGLPKQDDSWNIKCNGSGFSPPYTFPSASKPPAPYDEDMDIEIKMREKVLHVPGSTANKFMRNMTSRYPPCAKVFCDRNLETGLNDFMKAELAKGYIPTDSAIQTIAREIAGCAQTAADDPQLLVKFKALHGITENTDLSRHMDRLPDINSSHIGNFPTNSNSTSDSEMAMLQQFDAELGLGRFDGSNGIPSMPINFDFGKAVVESQVETEETDYASLYRAHTATASPLRRRASHITACKAGYSTPRPVDGIPENSHEDNANLVPHYMGFYPYMNPRHLSLPAEAFDVFGTDPDASTF